MNILTSLLLLLIGAVLGSWFTIFLTRPKLSIVGSGGGGGPGPGYYQNNVRIGNQPGLIGFRISESILFGRKINSRIEKGLTFDRSPAHDCRASLLDQKTGEIMCPLWWRSSVDGKITQGVTINSGESVDLMLFARTNDEASKYFVYEPESGSVAAPKIPTNEAKFEKTKNFIVEIRSYGRKKLKIKVVVRRSYNGTLSYSIDGNGGGSF